MGEYGGSIIDPSSGVPGTTYYPGPGVGSGARWAGAKETWTPPPNLVSAKPADDPYETGEKPSFGPIPENIVARADDGCDHCDGFTAEDIADSNDGDDDHREVEDLFQRRPRDGP
jgi:hypothetical protein